MKRTRQDAKVKAKAVFSALDAPSGSSKIKENRSLFMFIGVLLAIFAGLTLLAWRSPGVFTVNKEANGAGCASPLTSPNASGGVGCGSRY